jgi:hypothetical protein
MFDAKKLDSVVTPSSSTTDLEKMDVGQLLDLRQRIEALLPARKLADIDLEQEIVLQYLAAQALMQKTSIAVDIPANQKAQVQNSCASILDQLLKMQTRIYSAERMKAIEQVLIKVLKTLPEEAQRQFFHDYERMKVEGQE